MSPVPEDDIAHIADPVTVDEHLARRDAAVESRAIAVDLKYLAYGGHEYVLRGHSHFESEILVIDEMAVFAVDRHEVFRLGKSVHQHELLTARMSGDMHFRSGVVHHSHAAPVELVYDLSHKLFVAGDRVRAEDDHVIAVQSDLVVT